MADTDRVKNERASNGGRAQEPERTPPAENSAAWVEKYVAWASQVLTEKKHSTQK